MMPSGLLMLDRFVCMSKALCRYVGLLRAVNGVKLNPILKEELRLLFTESGAAWAETYIASGNVVFECPPAKLPDLLRRAHNRLRIQHDIEQPIIVRKMTELVALREGGVPPINRPDYIGVTATFLSCPAKTMPELPVTSRRGDICVFEMRKDVVLSHRFQVNGNAGDANALAERLFGVPGTSRSWNTVRGLVRKFNASPTAKGSG
jgi:uncharacterized protein (DUF1697 family)